MVTVYSFFLLFILCLRDLDVFKESAIVGAKDISHPSNYFCPFLTFPATLWPFHTLSCSLYRKAEPSEKRSPLCLCMVLY